MLGVTRKLFQLVFLWLKQSARRWCWRHIAKRDGPVLVLNLFCLQKNIRKAYVKKFSLLVYLTEGYESTGGIWNKIDDLFLLQNFLQIDRCSEIILATAKNKFRIICIEVNICSVCPWCIFRLSLSFTDFISSISERLTAAPKFHNFFFTKSFSKLLYKLRICFNTIPSNYRPKKDVVISPIKEVIN